MSALISTLITQPLFYIILPTILTFWPKINKKLKWSLWGLSFFLFLFFSNTSLYNWFERQWYADYDSQTIENQCFQYGIVLGGYSYWDYTRNRPEFSEIGDRLFEGINLYHQRKIKKLILASDGSIINATSNPTKGNPESMRDYIIALGIKPEDLILETKANNTHENATFTLELIGDSLKNQPTLLITSAIHMKRAILAFNQIEVYPQPWTTDTQLVTDRWCTIIPSINTLAKWPALLHEWIGYVIYKYRYKN